MTDSDLRELRAALLTWYDENRRDLPWRFENGTPPDPYRVWLSEVMLQQTRVDTVLSYYHRWLERFPTLQAVAEAPLDDILKAWEGLGYYSRARNFHRAVREVHERYGGALPGDPDAFRSLPGVGRYTAGAVMSIAFGHEQPVVDGNVRRVFARWLERPEPSEPELWDLARRLVRGARPGCLNQAVMELGAIVCTPRAQRCTACPAASRCAARAAGTQEQHPRPKRRGPLPHEARVATVVESDGRLLLARAPSRGRLAGLWEFPGDCLRTEEAPGPGAERGLAARLGVRIAAGSELGMVVHTFTHVRVSYHVVRGTLLEGTPRPLGYQEVRWVHPRELASLALPKAQQRIAALALRQRSDDQRHRKAETPAERMS